MQQGDEWIPIENGNMTPEHRAVMDNMLKATAKSMEGRICRMMREAKYQWDGDVDADMKPVFREPDVSILCGNFHDRLRMAYKGVPVWIMEVLSPSTEALDRGERMQAYLHAGVQEVWLADWTVPKVECYMMSDDTCRYELVREVTRENKQALRILTMGVDVDFDRLFDIYWD